MPENVEEAQDRHIVPRTVEAHPMEADMTTGDRQLQLQIGIVIPLDLAIGGHRNPR